MKEDVCIHYESAFTSQCCAVGINYNELAGGHEPGWIKRLPCIPIGDPDKKGACAKKLLPTAEQLAVHEAAIDALLTRIEKVDPLIGKIKVVHAGNDADVATTCPICEGILHVHHSAFNGHTNGHCETDGCVNWME